MKINVSERNSMIELSEVYNPILFTTSDNEQLSICMRDTGFEFTYGGFVYEAKNGKLNKL